MSKQDVLLDAMSEPDSLDLLYGLWTIANKVPSRCAEILLSYKDVSRAIRIVSAELEEAHDELKRVEAGRESIASMLHLVREWKAEMKTIDEEVFLNRMNRLCDVADRIAGLKRSGSLNSLRMLLEDKQ